MFNRGIRLPFTLLGIPVMLDWTFLIILPWLAWLIGSRVSAIAELLGVRGEILTGGAMPFLLGLIAAVGLFVGVVLHELGHAVTARAYGVKVHSITLWFLGGVARFEDLPRKSGAEAVIAIVGPIVSFALAGLCLLARSFVPIEMVGTHFVLAYLTYMNFVLAIFNLIPALPLDGGRILRSLLALWTDFARATRISGWVSRVLAILLGLLGIMTLNFFVILVALFIFMAASTETNTVRLEGLLEGVPVRRLMNPRVSTVSPDTRAGNLAALLWQERHTAFPVVDDQGRVLGIVNVQDAQSADPATPARALLHGIPQVSEDSDATHAFRAMLRNGMSGVVVTDAAGRLRGIVTRTDLLRAIQMLEAGVYSGVREGEPHSRAARHAYGW